MSEELRTVTRDIEAAPGEGWRYTVPGTGVTLTAKWAKELRGKIRKHMEANGLVVPSDEVLNDAMCRQSGLGAPYCGNLKRTKRPEGEIVNLSFAHVAKFLRAVKYALVERKFVKREEAHRRAAVCMSCPLATDVGNCASCHQVGKLLAYATKFVDKFGIDVPSDKRHCGACGCLISLKTTIDLDVLRRVDAKEEIQPAYWENCWMREEKP